MEGIDRARTLGIIHGEVWGRTSDGSIKLEGCSGRADIKTSGGGIHIGNVDGDVEASTSGADVLSAQDDNVRTRFLKHMRHYSGSNEGGPVDFIRKIFPAPSGEELAERLMKEFRRIGVEGPMLYDSEKWIIDVGEPPMRVNLANLHADLALNMPWRRGAIIRRFASHLGSGVFDRPKTLDEARPHLLPNLRDPAMWRFLQLDGELQGNEALEIPRMDLTSRLSAALYVDAEHGMSMVTAEDLEQWGISLDEGMKLALENLTARSSEPFSEVAEGVWASPWSDCYDTARLLLPDKLREVTVDGNLVAFCPHWNTLLLTGSKNTAGLAGCLESAAKQISEAPKPLTAQPIEQRYPGWQTLHFGRGHELYDLWVKARVYEMVGAYNDQQVLLQEWCEMKGDDVFVAQCSGVEQDDTKDVRSYCVWSKGVASLLPEADQVMLFEDDKPEDDNMTQIDWEVMWALCEPLLTATDHVPVRWRVEGFPEPSTIQMMKEVQERRSQR